MFRFTWLDAAIIGGGIVLTSIVVAAVVKAKPEEEVTPTPTPPYVPPPTLPTPGIPAAIEFPTYPTSLNQLYGFYYTMASPASPQILQYRAVTSFKGPPYSEGSVTKQAKLRVVDSAGRGVPNVAVLVWSVPTNDDQSGRLIINNTTRSEATPLRLTTDANGEITLNLIYLLKNIAVLENKHSFGCCTVLGRARDINVTEGCGPVPVFYVCYRAKDARTDLKAYTVNARIEGTVKANLFVVSCQTIGKALW